jgi:hypothetical protein
MDLLDSPPPSPSPAPASGKKKGPGRPKKNTPEPADYIRDEILDLAAAKDDKTTPSIIPKECGVFQHKYKPSLVRIGT